MFHGEFRDRRLVEVYDAECPWSRDDDFFLSVVNETPGARVLDLGCGTGRLALGMMAAGHTVTGIDPASASLDAARAKPGAGEVTWVEGTSALLGPACFDVAVMTSHVAQFFVDDAEWTGVLADLARALVPGGILVFDARDPDARAWERWSPHDSRRRVVLSGDRVVHAWTEVVGLDNGAVTFTHHYSMPGGDELVSTATLRFRSEHDVRQALAAAGFAVEHVYGGWLREPVGAPDGEFLFVCRRT